MTTIREDPAIREEPAKMKKYGTPTILPATIGLGRCFYAYATANGVHQESDASLPVQVLVSQPSIMIFPSESGEKAVWYNVYVSQPGSGPEDAKYAGRAVPSSANGVAIRSLEKRCAMNRIRLYLDTECEDKAANIGDYLFKVTVRSSNDVDCLERLELYHELDRTVRKIGFFLVDERVQYSHDDRAAYFRLRGPIEDYKTHGPMPVTSGLCRSLRRAIEMRRDEVVDEMAEELHETKRKLDALLDRVDKAAAIAVSGLVHQ